jgi:hypothetical protein
MKLIEHPKSEYSSQPSSRKQMSDDQMLNTIGELREAGFSDAAIKKYLKEQGHTGYSKFFKVSEKKKEIERQTGVRRESKKVTVKEVSALRDQIRFEARAARDAALNEKSARKKIAKALKDSLEKMPRVFKPKQVEAIMNRALNMNLSSPEMEQRFIEYVEKVYRDAEYAAKEVRAVKKQKAIKGKIKKKGERQNKNVAVAKGFSLVKPSLVEDIDAYIEMADKVLAGLDKSKIKDNEFQEKQTPVLAEISKYSEEQIKRQDEIQRNTLLDMYSDLVDLGVISESDSLAEMRRKINEAADKKDKLSDEDRRAILNQIVDRFN